MIVSPYRTSVTAAHQDDNKRVAPSVTRRGGPGTRRKNVRRFDAMKSDD